MLLGPCVTIAYCCESWSAARDITMWHGIRENNFNWQLHVYTIDRGSIVYNWPARSKLGQDYPGNGYEEIVGVPWWHRLKGYTNQKQNHIVSI